MCVSECVTASTQADVSSDVSERQAVGPHGLLETDRISISLAGGLYSSMGKSVCVCVCVCVFFLWSPSAPVRRSTECAAET